MQLLRRADPETAKNIALLALRFQLLHAPPDKTSHRLESRVWNLRFTNPLGLAAGLDKGGQALAGCFKVGFGFVELGTVTPRPQAGNPRPRIFRLPEDKALINRMGFNSRGVNYVRKRVTERPAGHGVVGINIGANADSENRVSDYAMLLDSLYGLGDYFTINVSSPNTVALRNFQKPENLEHLLSCLSRRREELSKVLGRKPMLVKLSPDIGEDDLEKIATVVVRFEIDGFVISNTTVGRSEELRSPAKQEIGGLSGAPLRAVSTAMIRRIFEATEGSVPIIGVGGILNAQDAYEKIRAGASLLQVYTGLTYEGPRLIIAILSGLCQLLEADGLTRVGDAIGLDAKNSNAMSAGSAHSEAGDRSSELVRADTA